MAGSNSTPGNVVKQIDKVSLLSSDNYCNSDTKIINVKQFLHTVLL